MSALAGVGKRNADVGLCKVVVACEKYVAFGRFRGERSAAYIRFADVHFYKPFGNFARDKVYQFFIARSALL